jgi:serine/threonine protein kinase
MCQAPTACGTHAHRAGKLPAPRLRMLPRASDLGPEALIGSYRLVREIGRGGMGSVYEAQHSVLPRRAAIKVMHEDLRKHPGMATRMVQEAAILEDIRHPGIVRVFECNVLPDHRPWIAMELVPGESLARRLSRDKQLPADEVAPLLANVADVLCSVHVRGIVHRDLKPDNLLLPADDREFPVRVIDWGVARLGPVGRFTLEGMTPGTPIYMAPEQAMGKGVGAPADLYALGVIAYETLAGRPPFDGRTLAEVVAMHLSSDADPLAAQCDAPAQLCELVHRLLSKQPSQRPTTAEVRTTARAIAVDLAAAAYASMEISEPVLRIVDDYDFDVDVELGPAGPPSDEVVIVDPELLETGTTEMFPVAKPRWTPPLGGSVMAKSPRGVVAGEIIVRTR